MSVANFLIKITRLKLQGIELPSLTRKTKISLTILLLLAMVIILVILSPKKEHKVKIKKHEHTNPIITVSPLPANQFTFYQSLKTSSFVNYDDNNLTQASTEQKDVINDLPNNEPFIFKAKGPTNAFLCGKFSDRDYAMGVSYFLDAEKIRPYRVVSYNNLFSIVIGPIKSDKVSSTRQALRGIGLGCVDKSL